jgi:hypothetical protein
MSEVELVRVGGGHCLFQPSTHALALLNDAAVELWHRRFEDRQLGADDIEMMEAWRSAGFLEPGIATAGRNGPELKRERAANSGLSICCADKVSLVVDDNRLRRLLAAALSPMCTPGDGFVDVSVRTDAAGDYEITLDGDLLARCDSMSEARRTTLQAILLALHGIGNVSALLHASAVEIAGRAVIIAGPTEAGKSTLTAALVAAGGHYLGDDLIGLGPDGTSIGTFPVAASIKSGSFDVVRHRFPQLDQAEIHELAERRVRYLDLAPTSKAALRSLPVGAVLVPAYTPGAPLEVQPLTAIEAFAGLIESGTEIVGRPRSAAPLARLLNEHPLWRVTYGDLDAAVRTILEFARRA